MLVHLESLKPNPRRDFKVDPLDDDRVNDLVNSIREDGFWGGVICRWLDDGTIEIGAGHHRVNAAILAGLKTADVFVSKGEMDDRMMIRVYARENATQRGNTGTAQVGSVASALRYLAKLVLTNTVSEELFGHSLEIIRGQIVGDKGLGRDVILRFLAGIPGINDGSVQHALANLKSSGEYARIIREVQQEIERETQEAIQALEDARREQERLRKAREDAEVKRRQARSRRLEAEKQARIAREKPEKEAAEFRANQAEIEQDQAEVEVKQVEEQSREVDQNVKKNRSAETTRKTAQEAADAASNGPVTFDFSGVSRYLKNTHQVNTFRQCVTDENVASCLPVNRQADLAQLLVERARVLEEEPSGRFIQDHISEILIEFRNQNRSIEKKNIKDLEQRDIIFKCKKQQEKFMRGCRVMVSSGVTLADLIGKWPDDLTFPVDPDLLRMIQSVRQVIIQLQEKVDS